MESKREWWVGLMFFAALAVMLFVTTYLSDLTLASGSSVSVVFDSVKGLREGDDVNVAGMRIGKVRGVQYVPERGRVRVELWLNREIRLSEGYRISINDASLLGGTVVNIHPGDPDGAIVEATGDLAGAPPVAIMDSLGNVLGNFEEDFGGLLADLRVITRDLRAGKGSMGQLLTDASLVEDLSATAKSLRSLSERLESGEGTIGRLLSEGSVYEDLESTMSDLADIGEQLRDGDGTLARLLRDGDLHDQLQDALSGFRELAGDIREGDGTIARLVNDPTLYEKAEEIVDRLASVAGDLEEGRGTLGLLLRDEEQRARVESLIADLTDVVDELRNGEGTLSMLLRSDELHTELVRTLRVVGGAIEDARESAPLSTFSAALFSAF